MATTDSRPADNTSRRHTALWIALAIFGALIIAAAIFIGPFCLTSSARDVVIRIPKAATTTTLRDSLGKYFDSAYADRTLKAFNALGRTPAQRFGAYEIPEGSSPIEAARILSRGAQTPVRFTINGVRLLDSFLPLVAAKFNFSATELAEAVGDPELLSQYGLTPEQAPDLFLNDTYFLYWTVTPRQLIEKLGDNYRRLWNAENRAKADSLGLTPAEIMTIASIVDEETQVASEKGRIGRLYINRLHKGMRLQADPTVKYALKDFSIRRITGQHLSAPGPYNTYRVDGLPPGPIRTTSAATVQAILDSAPSDDIYMCAKEDFSGSHNFTSDYQQHLENARRYQKALDERNITSQPSSTPDSIPAN